MIARCKCGKTKKFRGNRHHFTCPECRERNVASGIEIACAGCGRTQRVRASKVIPCEGYTCARGKCKQNPGFEIPEPPIGWYCQVEFHAAAGFSGWTFRPHTPETLAAVWRACEIRDLGIAMIEARRNEAHYGHRN